MSCNLNFIAFVEQPDVWPSLTSLKDYQTHLLEITASDYILNINTVLKKDKETNNVFNNVLRLMGGLHAIIF